MQSLRKFGLKTARSFVNPYNSTPLRFQSSFRNAGGPDRWWMIGALAFSMPAGIYLYNRHSNDKQEKHIPISDLSKQYEGAIIIPSLKEDEFKESTTSAEKLSTMEPKTYKSKYVLIGGGLAAFAAMESILANDDQAEILLVTEESYPPYMRPPLSKELWYNHEKDKQLDEQFEFADWHGQGKPIFFQDISFYDNPEDDALKPREQHRKAKLLTGKKVVYLDAAANTMTLHDGTKIQFEKALIATGASPKDLAHVQDPNVTNISYLRKLTDFKRLRNVVDTVDHIAIIGGGFIGSELAASIASYAEIERPDKPLKITQIFPEVGNMGLVFPKYLSSWAMKQLRKLGIDIWPNSTIKEISRISDSKARIEITSTEDGNRIIDVDHVIVAIGAKPNVELAKLCYLPLDDSEFGYGGLKVSPELQVVPSKIFAAGDVISFYDSSLDVWRRVEHYDHALASGKIAGYNMTTTNPSKQRPYNAISIFWSDLGPSIGYEAVGLVDSSLTTVGVWAKAQPKDTPAKVEYDTEDVRTQSVGQTSPSSVAPVTSTVQETFDQDSYRKGLVVYSRNHRIVGLLMFNLFNRTALAKNVIKQKLTLDDLQDVVELFNINDI